MRQELLEYEEPGLWNSTVKEIKRKVLEGALGGERREFWWLIRRNRVGLIEGKREGEVSGEEAREFFAGK